LSPKTQRWLYVYREICVSRVRYKFLSKEQGIPYYIFRISNVVVVNSRNIDLAVVSRGDPAHLPIAGTFAWGVEIGRSGGAFTRKVARVFLDKVLPPKMIMTFRVTITLALIITDVLCVAQWGHCVRE
jgi:hypothetical protein